jgi:esterase/lipase superfamily enzyme
LRLSACTIFFLVLVGCAPNSSRPLSEFSEYASPKSNEIRLNWYTNRVRDYSPDANADSSFTPKLNPNFAQKGVLTVAIPENFRAGQSVASKPRLETDDAKFNQELIYGAYDPLYSQCATVFVHGYNTTIEEAQERALQLFAGMAHIEKSQARFVPKAFTFSWPSVGLEVDKMDIGEWIRTGYPFYTRAYRYDEAAAAASRDSLAGFMKMLCRRDSNYRETNVIAHSLGTFLTTEALATLSRENSNSSDPCKINHLVLASGDMNLFRFRTLLPDLLQIANRITLYVNSTLIERAFRSGVSADIPLVMSKLMHFLAEFELGPRIGQQGVLLQLLDQRVEIVVMKELDSTGDLGHYQNFTHPAVLSDMALTLSGQKNTARRMLSNPRTFMLGTN